MERVLVAAPCAAAPPAVAATTRRAVCSVANCLRRTKARGLCDTHYRRLRRIGHTDDPQPIREQIAGGPTVRFWRGVEVTDTCWLWVGYRNRGGYGEFRIGKRCTKVHRFAYELLVGPIPEGLELDHLCRVRNCVNPAHLEPVTPAENTRRSLPYRKTKRASSASITPPSDADDRRVVHRCQAGSA